MELRIALTHSILCWRNLVKHYKYLIPRLFQIPYSLPFNLPSFQMAVNVFLHGKGDSLSSSNDPLYEGDGDL